jgi:tetratricopeptide (TPR) repeat protein
MQASNKRRALLYGTAALTLTGLVYGGFVYQSKADVQTLLSCAQPQLSLRLFDHAERFVLEALEQEPENFEGLTMLAAIHEGRGQSDEALALYLRLLPRAESADMQAELSVAIARIELSRGGAERALQRLEALSPTERDTRWKKAVLRAHCLKALGRSDELPAAVQQVEELSGPAWSSSKLRQELGLAPAEPQSPENESAESSAAVQGGAADGR